MAIFNAPNAQLVIQNFGLQAVQTNVYKGKFPTTTRDVSPIQRKSVLGTSIFSDLQFKSVIIPSAGGFTELSHDFPVDTVLFTVSQQKNIIRTQIQGRDGTIKEYVGKGDYEINIKGVITGKNGVYPKDAVDNLIEFLNYNQSIGIISSFLNERLNIDEIVILKYDLPQDEGGQSFQKFEIDAVSEFPVEILIQQQK